MDSATCGDAMKSPSSCGFASPRNPSSCVVVRYAAGPMRGQSSTVSCIRLARPGCPSTDENGGLQAAEVLGRALADRYVPLEMASPRADLATCSDGRIWFLTCGSMLQPFPTFLDASRSFAGRMRDERGTVLELVCRGRLSRVTAGSALKTTSAFGRLDQQERSRTRRDGPLRHNRATRLRLLRPRQGAPGQDG